MSRVHYRVSAYLQRGSELVPRPSIHTLASVLQSVVQSGWVGAYQTLPTSHYVNGRDGHCRVQHSQTVTVSSPPVQCACEKDDSCYAVSNDLQPFACLPCSLSDRYLDGLICRAVISEVSRSCGYLTLHCLLPSPPSTSAGLLWTRQ